MKLKPLVVWLLLAAGTQAQTSEKQNQAFAGNLSTAQFNNEIYPSVLDGATCGDKISAAVALLAGKPGLISVNSACGLGSANSPWAPISIPANVALRFTQPGIYWITSITLAGGSALSGLPSTMGIGGAPNPPIVQLELGNRLNSPQGILLNGQFITLRDFVIDGNKSNNPTAGPNISANSKSHRLNIDNVTTQNSSSHGILLTSSVAPKISKLMTQANNKDGLYCDGGASGGDGFVSMSEFENNGANGMELNDCPAWRILQSDFGLNGSVAGDGLYIHGSAAIGSNFEIIVGNQFGNNCQNDLRIVGFNAGVTSIDNTIVANSFIGGGQRTPDSTYSELVLVDGGQNTVAGNSFAPSSPHRELYAVSTTETAAGRAYANTWGANTVLNQTSWGAATGSGFFDNTANGTFSQQLPTRGAVAGCAPMIDIFDIAPAAPSPHKYLSVGSGNLQVHNSDCTQVIFNLSDKGTLSVGASTVSALPAAPSSPGALIRVSDSTAIRNEGQSCAGGGTENALAFSNGVIWKCF